MNLHHRAALCCFVFSMVASVVAQTKVNTTASKVTLFIDGAQVTRSKQIDVPAGKSTVVFTGLSPYMDAKSVQVNATGQLTITSVNRQLNYMDTLAVSQQQQKLQDELKQVEKQEKEQHHMMELIQKEEALLQANCTLGDKTSVPTATTIKEVGTYYSTQLAALSAKKMAIDEKIAALTEKRKKIEGELAQFTNKRKDPLSEVVVGINAPVAGRVAFTLSYYVRNAGWIPSYDVRSSGLNAPLSLTYKANIYQNTREEWKNVALTLSSSNPSAGNVAPELATYWLDYGLMPPRYNNRPVGSVSGVVTGSDHEPLIGVSVMIPGTTFGTITDIDGHYSLVLPDKTKEIKFAYIGYLSRTLPIQGETMNVTLQEDAVMLEEVVVKGYSTTLTGKTAGAASNITAPKKAATPLDVEQIQTQAGYEFDIKLPYTILSDNKPVVAEIGNYELPVSYTYQCAPKREKDAFLTAQVTDWDALNLLEGEANIFFENTFVGKSVVNVSEQSDTLSFSLGRDRRIVVQRTKEKIHTSRQLIGSNQTQTIAWKISVRNTRQESVGMTLYDQLPVSRNSDITVTPEELSGGALDKDQGIVNWQFTLKAGEQRDMILRYKVKYPKGRHLVIE
ncbi:MAG: mucoidy inhibitor MuiA family protein [Prevotellaceae bacterium]|jgi:hypothetical protein|nr:mucoidy inhibitor MuiA family protein [Prevotellaceae bacterium]